MTFFSRYAASHRASFEPAISDAENASSRTCCMYRDRTEGLMQGGGSEGDPEIRTRLLRKERFPGTERERAPASQARQVGVPRVVQKFGLAS